MSSRLGVGKRWRIGERFRSLVDAGSCPGRCLELLLKLLHLRAHTKPVRHGGCDRPVARRLVAFRRSNFGASSIATPIAIGATSRSPSAPRRLQRPADGRPRAAASDRWPSTASPRRPAGLGGSPSSSPCLLIGVQYCSCIQSLRPHSCGPSALAASSTPPCGGPFFSVDRVPERGLRTVPAMNAPLRPDVFTRPQPSRQLDLPLASDGVQRNVWESRFGTMLIEVRAGQVFVNGSRVEPAEGQGPAAEVR